ncbi:hypothetical protein [Dyella silvae]|uniref:hypothetical protein n=1 Tax=Dyella silvae TaxID=2994424 RepID=UPI0022656A53|nr:hypothetical protein [Dyella silvae]
MNKLPQLTRREQDVLGVLCEPLNHGGAFVEPASIRQIADALGVSDAAVKQHLIHLYDKFGIFEGEARRRVRLANLAFGAGAGRCARDVPTPEGPAAEHLMAGRAAARARNWPRAFELLSLADQSGMALSPEDLEALGEAAMITSRHDRSVEARQRAHAIYVRDGEVLRAAMVELALVFNYAGRLDFVQASAWFSKAARGLADVQPERAHGYLAVTEALFKLGGGDVDGALALARQAHAVGDQFGDADLQALGLAFQGQALAQMGQMDQAAPLLDEAMASATCGELGPLATGLVYCRTLCACLDAFDYCRAREWTKVIDRAAEDHCMSGFSGDCRAHRASIFSLRGDWVDAEREAEIACAEKERIDLSHSAIANYEVGMIRLRRGDLEEASARFQRVHELGVSPQPGLALLLVERDERDAATASIRTAVEETPPNSLRRARLLMAQVEIAALVGNAALAQAAAYDLNRIVSSQSSFALKAFAKGATGIAALTDGDAAAALGPLREACQLWLRASAPYEAARIRMHLASALCKLDDEASAGLELDAARAVFERLDASPDIARAMAAKERSRKGFSEYGKQTGHNPLPQRK